LLGHPLSLGVVLVGGLQILRWVQSVGLVVLWVRPAALWCHLGRLVGAVRRVLGLCIWLFCVLVLSSMRGLATSVLWLPFGVILVGFVLQWCWYWHGDLVMVLHDGFF